MPPKPLLLLRKMEVSDVIDAAIRLYRRNFAQLLGIAAVVYVPVLGLQALLLVQLMNLFMGTKGTGPAGDQVPWAQLIPLGAGWLGVILASAVLLPLAEGACCIAVSELYLGRTITVVEAYRRVLPSFWKLIGTYVLIGLINGFAVVAIIIGFIMLILPGLAATAGFIWVEVVLLFCWPVVVLEGPWGPQAMVRSYALVKDYFWRILGTWILLGAIIVLGQMMLLWPIQIAAMVLLGDANPLMVQAVSQAAASVVAILMKPIVIIGTVLLYYDARIRREGFDLQVMAEALGRPEAALGLKPAAAPAPAAPLLAPPAGVVLPPRPGEELLPKPPLEPPSDGAGE